MTKEEKVKVLKLKSYGFGYKQISKQLNLPLTTVSSFIRRNELNTKQKDDVCKYCGKKIEQTKGHRKKLFCDAKCKNAWWYINKDKKDTSNQIIKNCKFCGKEFSSYETEKRVFCSRSCYINYLNKEGKHHE